MDTSTPSLDLMEFIEQNILPRYNNFDLAHNIRHANMVIKNSLALAKITGADVNMVYAIAAYHDLGLDGPRAVHHITSGKILLADRRLRQWFTEEQIKIMKEAVEDHRASASHAPRSIYGKIVAEADRDLEPDHIFRRTIQYGMAHYPELSRDKQWERFLQHMDQKYSAHGYIRLWMPGSPNESKLRVIRELLCDQTALRATFDRIFEEELKAL
uniref:HD domain-containing protein n=1 Tax=Prevotella sp. TaxID=59823 RepID=UPI004027E8E1